MYPPSKEKTKPTKVKYREEWKLQVIYHMVDIQNVE